MAKRVERLVNLCAFLLRPRATASAEEIQRTIPQYAEFKQGEAFRKALQRDIRALRDIGVPVEVNEHNEYFISEREYSLPVVSFSTEELYCLAMASKAAGALGPPIEDYAASAWRKITFDQWSETKQIPEPEETVVFQPRAIAPRLRRHHLETLFEALMLRKRLALRYRDRQGQTTERQIDPYALAAFDGQWYLVAWCHLRGEIRTLRCSRILSLSKASSTGPDESDYSVPRDFRVGDYIGQLRWRLRRRHDPVMTKVRFSPEVWWWVKRHWGASEDSQDLEDGGGIFAAPVTDRQAFLECVLEFGRNAEILEPQALRNEAAQALSRILDAHQK